MELEEEKEAKDEKPYGSQTQGLRTICFLDNHIHPSINHFLSCFLPAPLFHNSFHIHIPLVLIKTNSNVIKTLSSPSRLPTCAKLKSSEAHNIKSR